MATHPSDIVLSDDQRQQLADLANRSGQPRPDLLDSALAAYRPPQDRSDNEPRRPGESLGAAAKRLGLAGSVRGGPADLSVNPVYLEGLGTDDE